MKNFKKYIRKQKYRLLLVTCVLLSTASGCVEDTSIETDVFEDLLVIDASISNEEKQHEILLSRTYRYGGDPVVETAAIVTIIGNGFEYNFEEVEGGKYVSQDVFEAILNVDYRLQIITAEGNVYSSTNKKLTTVIEIDDLYIERMTNDDGVEGMAFYVDSFDPSNRSKFYRYEYESTFKIIAPMWVHEEAFVIGNECPRCEVGLEDRPENTRVCYSTERSNELNVLENATLDTDKVVKYLIHFVPSTDYKLSHRYSLLARQFVISEGAYLYYKTLGDFSSEGSVFSQIQTGFVEGNITSESNPAEKVIGYFDVNSVSEKRVFFNYDDYYPGEVLPDFAILCSLQAPSLQGEYCPGPCGPLTTLINNKAASYLEDYVGTPEFFGGTGPYIMIPRACGDCTVLGTNEMPEFWTQ